MVDDNEINSGEYNTAPPQPGFIKGQTFPIKQVQYSEVEGDAIFEGDIILDTVEDMRRAYKATTEPDVAPVEGVGVVGHRWEGGVIPYEISNDLTNKDRVTQAIKMWTDRIPQLKFVKRNGHADYVVFRRWTNLSSRVGRRGGTQYINITDSGRVGNIAHEIGHALGLWHEQSREDRNKHVTIDLSNVEEDARHNFNQQITDGDDYGAYDYGSIMHYSAFAFARDTSKPTIIPKVPGVTIGQRERLSEGDVATVKVMYGF